jgi:hypothetical protein
VFGAHQHELPLGQLRLLPSARSTTKAGA